MEHIYCIPKEKLDIHSMRWLWIYLWACLVSCRHMKSLTTTLYTSIDASFQVELSLNSIIFLKMSWTLLAECTRGSCAPLPIPSPKKLTPAKYRDALLVTSGGMRRNAYIRPSGMISKLFIDRVIHITTNCVARGSNIGGFIWILLCHGVLN